MPRRHFGKEKLENRIEQEYDIRNLSSKFKNCIVNRVLCLVSYRKRRKKEGFLHLIPNAGKPLQTYNADFLGPMSTTDKQYKHVFAVTNGFSKYCLLYASRITSSSEVINKLDIQQSYFENP